MKLFTPPLRGWEEAWKRRGIRAREVQLSKLKTPRANFRQRAVALSRGRKPWNLFLLVMFMQRLQASICICCACGKSLECALVNSTNMYGIAKLLHKNLSSLTSLSGS